MRATADTTALWASRSAPDARRYARRRARPNKNINCARSATPTVAVRLVGPLAASSSAPSRPNRRYPHTPAAAQTAGNITTAMAGFTVAAVAGAIPDMLAARINPIGTALSTAPYAAGPSNTSVSPVWAAIFDP